MTEAVQLALIQLGATVVVGSVTIATAFWGRNTAKRATDVAAESVAKTLEGNAKIASVEAAVHDVHEIINSASERREATAADAASMSLVAAQTTAQELARLSAENTELRVKLATATGTGMHPIPEAED